MGREEGRRGRRGEAARQTEKRALSGPASIARHVYRWRVAARERWLVARGLAR